MKEVSYWLNPRYLVREDGRVWDTELECEPSIFQDSYKKYPALRLRTVDNKIKYIQRCRVVAEAFLNGNSKLHSHRLVHPKDGNEKNCRVDNLFLSNMPKPKKVKVTQCKKEEVEYCDWWGGSAVYC